MSIVLNMVTVALLESLNHDDGGEEDDDYDGSCWAFKAHNQYGALPSSTSRR